MTTLNSVSMKIIFTLSTCILILFDGKTDGEYPMFTKLDVECESTRLVQFATE